MTRDVHRIGDANDAGGAITNPNQSSVFANSILVAVDGAIGTSHPPCPVPDIHCSGNWVTVNTGQTVFSENIQTNRLGDVDTCSHVRASGSPDVFIGDEMSAPQPGDPDSINKNVEFIGSNGPQTISFTALEIAVTGTDDDVELTVQNQAITSSGGDPNLNEPATIIDEDTDTPPEEPPPVDPNCDNINDPPGDLQLSPNFTLADLSYGAALESARVRAQSGLSAPEIVCNLKALAENTLEGIAAQVGRNTMLITSAWRPAKNYNSQHHTGQATDIQFPGFTNQQIYDVAIFIKENLPFDQLILEYGPRRPWIHVSFNRSGNRPVTQSNKVLNYRFNRQPKYQAGLILI